MTNKTRTIIAALAAMLCLSVGMSAVAGAAGTTPKLTIHYTGDGFEGKIKNVKPKCLADREVTVHKGNGRELYSDTTEDDGSWNTGNSGQVSGKFYATVNARGNCTALTSKKIIV